MDSISIMKPGKDAYGHEILAHFQGKDSFEIVEGDDGYFGVSSGSKQYFSEYRNWRGHEKKAIKFAKGRVLDVGCGAGRHSIYLQKEGLDVTGIDSSPLAIEVCKKRGLKKARVMPISDVGRFDEGAFDTIIMLGNNFGLFGGLKRARLLLKKFYRITSPDALIIAESLDPYKTDNTDYLEYHRSNRKRGRMAGQARIRIRFGKYVSGWFDYLFVSKKEMRDILGWTGWEVKRFIDSKGSSYIAIIRKVQGGLARRGVA